MPSQLREGKQKDTLDLNTLIELGKLKVKVLKASRFKKDTSSLFYCPDLNETSSISPGDKTQNAF